MKYEVIIDDNVHTVDVTKGPDGFEVTVDETEPIHVDVSITCKYSRNVLMAGRSFEVGVIQRDDSWEIELLGNSHTVVVEDPKRKALKQSSGSEQGLLITAMPGRVVRTLVSVGQSVAKGDAMIVIEAMKMENEMKSSISGVVAEILVEEGQPLAAGASLIRVESANG
jgi:biotin carboxyl carrier protein